MSRFVFRRLTLAAVAASVPAAHAYAHCFAGARFFPATLVVDDPCIADELSLPTISFFKNGDNPSANVLDISAEYSKRITDTFGVSVGSTWTQLRPPGGPTVSGFQNLDGHHLVQVLSSHSCRGPFNFFCCRPKSAIDRQSPSPSPAFVA
jgi:hypothetical protein